MTQLGATYNGAPTHGANLPALAKPLLTADDAAELLQLTRNRRLPHVRVGRRILFLRSDLAAWIVANRVMPRS